MNVLIVGGGEVGVQLADALHHSHNVTIVDANEEQQQSFETVDVQFMRGNGSDPEDLRRAGAAEMDAFVACTGNDDVNVLACLAAKGLGAKETMAFVTRQRYVDAFAQRGAMESVGLSIDRILWPQRTLSDQIVDIIRVPRALDSSFFADGRIKMLEYKLEPGDPYTGKPLMNTTLPGGVLVVGSIRGESFIIPSGKTVLSPGDKVVFMGATSNMRAVERDFAPRRRNTNIALIGGGNVGFMVAQQLQEERANITIIEQDEARCRKLATWLPKALVLHGDGSDIELLEQERIEDADVLVAATNDDARNLLVSLMGKNMGIPKIITRISRKRNRQLFDRVGIDIALTSRAAAVQEVINWLQVDEVEHLASIEDRAEVMEVTYPRGCQTGKLSTLGAPPNSLIGAVLRKDKVIIPRGDTTLQHDDHLFIITPPDNVDAVEAWLERRQVA